MVCCYGIQFFDVCCYGYVTVLCGLLLWYTVLCGLLLWVSNSLMWFVAMVLGVDSTRGTVLRVCEVTVNDSRLKS